ncbi:MAG: polyisoprenyl-teichoic acid--peptidoglycan teichoic acid transferase, partial [Bacillota bacterium]|nr:polyisoprenyl-teichoic acid--peptidoglycan teichoic acid transferase [Bacillota bacterium]
MAERRRAVTRRLNWKKFLLFLGSVFLLALLAVGAGLYAFLGGLGPSGNEAAGRAHPEPAREEPINVLVLG